MVIMLKLVQELKCIFCKGIPVLSLKKEKENNEKLVFTVKSEDTQC